jgi:hypothetical protein
MENNIGSCTYENICEMLSKIVECPIRASADSLPCLCPFLKSDYSIENFPIQISSKIPEGKYRIRADFTDTSSTQTACVEVDLNIV